MFFKLERTVLKLLIILLIIPLVSLLGWVSKPIHMLLIASQLLAIEQLKELKTDYNRFSDRHNLINSNSTSLEKSNAKQTTLSTITFCPSNCYCIYKTVDCNNRNLTTFPQNLSFDVEVLKLRNNKISSLEHFSFQGYNRLTTLDLSENFVKKIPDQLFHSIPQLKVLELRKNLFEDIPSAVKSFRQLHRLDLRFNNIVNITTNDVNCLIKSGVENIDLSRNLIKEWPAMHTNSLDNDYSSPLVKNRLAKLDLSGNQIVCLKPNNFAIFRNLHTLKLNRNNLESFIKDSFNGLHRLRFLDLSKNCLHSIGALSLHSVLRLESLNLAKNQLVSVEAGAFHGIERLRNLNLSFNRLNSNGLSEGGLYGLFYLTHLDLSFNEFSWIDISMLSYVSSLQWLSLANNQLQQLPINSFIKMKDLRYLSLAANRLDQIYRNAFAGLNVLEILDLSHNELAVFIEDGSCFNNAILPTLKSLNFAANRLKIIPPRAFEPISSQLKILDMTNNPIASISVDAFKGLKLSTLTMNSTSLFCDCTLQHFLKWIKQNVISSQHDFNSNISLVCKYPETLKGRDVKTLALEEKLCPNTNQNLLAKIIDEPPAMLKVLLGSDIVINCTAIGAATPLKIHWKAFEVNGISSILTQKLDTVITQSYFSTSNKSVDGIKLYGQLILKNVNVDDEADYQCVASNDYNFAYSKRVTLRVEKLPEIIHLPANYTALRGHNAVFTCSAIGIPQPTISWKKDELASFPAAVERRLHVRNNDDILYLLNVSSVDSGHYTCLASSDAGIVKASAYLTVFDSAFNNRLPSYLYNPLTQTVTLEKIKGQIVTLDCSTTIALVPFFIQWYHNGSVLQLDGSVQGNESTKILAKKSTQILVIQNADFSDSGMYTCKLFAQSQFLSSQSFKLSVFEMLENSVAFIDNTLKDEARKNIVRLKELSVNHYSIYNVKVYIFFILMVVFMLSFATVTISFTLTQKYKKRYFIKRNKKNWITPPKEDALLNCGMTIGGNEDLNNFQVLESVNQQVDGKLINQKNIYCSNKQKDLKTETEDGSQKILKKQANNEQIKIKYHCEVELLKGENLEMSKAKKVDVNLQSLLEKTNLNEN